jgi:putative hydrolase of the HAD superfamily
MASIEAVFLDVGGVLTLPAEAEAATFLTAHGAHGSPEEVERLHYLGMLAHDEATSSAGSGRPYLKGFLEAAGLSADLADAFDAAIRPAGWRPAIRSSLEALPALVATGVRLAIVSNSDGTLEERLVRAGVAQVGPGPGVALWALIDSGAVGIEKPDPRIFELALSACCVGPEAAVHVGDSRRMDVAGAMAAGIRPLHMDPFDLCPDRSHEHIHTLREVIELVQRDGA